jgi:hypothetical protein
MAEGWVLTIAHVDEDGGQADYCWGINEDFAQHLLSHLGPPQHEYLSTPEVNKIRRELDENGGTVIIRNEPT